MKKKVLFGIILLVGLFTITGYGKGVKTDDDKTLFTCKKNNIEETSKVTNDTYTKDIKRSVKLDDDGKLLYYTNDYIYHYNSEDRCNYWCEIKTDWYKDMDEKHYSGLKNTVKCSCGKDKSLEEINEYDITILDPFLRGDITYMKEDNSFELESWINKYEKADYNCN